LLILALLAVLMILLPGNRDSALAALVCAGAAGDANLRVIVADFDKVGKEALKFETQTTEPAHVEFLTGYTFAELLYLDGQGQRAATVLGEILETSEEEGMADRHPAQLAQGYFLLGFLLDSDTPPGSAPAPRVIQQAVAAYDRALDLDPNLDAARLNRGRAYEWLDQVEKAKEDHGYLDAIDQAEP
jgi:tetratricopeptide (TPR) repeat protein